MRRAPRTAVQPLSAVATLTSHIAPLHDALDYHFTRHNLLVANLAHVDTPNYRPRELVRTGAFEQQLGLSLAATAHGHQGSRDSSVPWQVEFDATAVVGPDGNGVSLDREAVKIAANNLRYETVATLIEGALAQLSWAAQDGRGA